MVKLNNKNVDNVKACKHKKNKSRSNLLRKSVDGTNGTTSKKKQTYK